MEEEIRPCIICGRDITKTGGMTDDAGDLYCCEGKCFYKYMDKTYGKHRWMGLGNGVEDEYGGYYICASETPSGYEGTGIFYTEWE